VAEKDRKRRKQFLLHLLYEEYEVLCEKASDAKMTKSEFVRNVILYGAARGKRNFSTEDAVKICYELNRIGNNINQIAYQANRDSFVSRNDIDTLKDQYEKILDLFSSFAMT